MGAAHPSKGRYTLSQSTTMRLRSALLVACTAWAAPAMSQVKIPCSSGAFGIAAQIVRIDPPGATATRLLANRQEAVVGLNDLICRGETLEFKGGTATRIELREGDRKVVRLASDPYTAENNFGQAAARAVDFIAGALRGIESLKPPPEMPEPTAIRAARLSATTANTAALQIRAMRLLQGLPRQRIVTDTPLLLSWRDGVAPYHCEAVSSNGDLVWRGDNPSAASWCQIPAGLSHTTQIMVRDAGGRIASWNINPVAWRDVPRPDWIVGNAGLWPSADSTAWAWWLWKTAAPSWRLQALAMLNQQAGQQWIAGYLRDQLLAEAAEFAP